MSHGELPLLNIPALHAYLTSELHLDASTALQSTRIMGGHSNETFFITLGSLHYVLRRPPLGPLLPTAHDVAREYRLLVALYGTKVPVPQPIVLCEDTTIIGAPFYVMERINGVAIRDRLPETFVADVAARAGLGESLIDLLADLHSLDWQALGLASFGKPTGYLERQVRRWTGQLDASRVRPLPDLDAVTQWLGQNIPTSSTATIVHGDYRLDNVLFAPTVPAHPLALIDWEMATIGDPLADLGYLLSFWREDGDPPVPFADATWEMTAQSGFSKRRDLIARYHERTGRAIDNIPFYVTLAIWKLAILLEGSYARFLAGTTDDPFFNQLEAFVPTLAIRALAVCQGDMQLL